MVIFKGPRVVRGQGESQASAPESSKELDVPAYPEAPAQIDGLLEGLQVRMTSTIRLVA